jgi:hypothetical protein
MQTFLPVRSFVETARILDYRRLGKQRVEARQIYNALMYPAKSRWRNHPAVLMWRDYEQSLIEYGNRMIIEWVRRGYNNTMPLWSFEKNPKRPWWFGVEKFHASHRSNLLRKDFEYYKKFGWKETDNLEYFWPTKHKHDKAKENKTK